MRSMALRLGSVLFVVALVMGGCASEDETAATANGEGGEASDAETSPDGSEVADPLVLVPPAAETLDPLTSCPDLFQETFPEGENTCFNVGGQDRGFYFAKPEGESDTPRPLLIAFNGTGGSGEAAFDEFGLQDYVDAGFMILAPTSNANGSVYPAWDAMFSLSDSELPNADLELFDSLVACTKAHFPVDVNRIYVTGHSAGGIMSNYLLQRRSAVLAGGVVASGIISLTKPQGDHEVTPMAVVVTWGGDNDDWSGDSEDPDEADPAPSEEEGGEGEVGSCGEPTEGEGAESAEEESEETGENSEQVSVPGISFVEQAALASKFYEENPGGSQIWCRGNDIGHEYLPFGNAYFIDFLLAHPKGLSDNPDWTFVESDGALDMTCGDGTYELPPTDSLTCDTDTDCAAFCNATAVCGVGNATVNQVLAPQLESYGLPLDAEDCDACIAKCEETVSGSALPGTDEEVMQCIGDKSRDFAPLCGPGIDGVYPYVDIVSACCEDQMDSAFCTYFCEIINTNSAAQVFFTVCAPWLPEETEEGGEAAEEEGGEAAEEEGGEAAEEGGEAAEEGGESAEEGGESAEEGGEAAEEGGESDEGDES